MKKRDVEMCVEAFRDWYVNLRHIFFLCKEDGDSRGMCDARRRWSEIEIMAFGFYCMLHRDSGLDVGQLFGEFGMYLKKSYYACEHQRKKNVTSHKNVIIDLDRFISCCIVSNYANLVSPLVLDSELD